MRLQSDILKVKEQLLARGGELSATIWQDLCKGDNMHDQSLMDVIWTRVLRNDNSVEGVKRGVISLLGGQNINLIPSESVGDCKNFCLAIANSGFGEKYYPKMGKIGFKGTMMKLIACWFTCIEINKENLLLTADWNQREFDELYKPIFEAYCKKYNKKAYIVVVSDSFTYLAYSI